jgi:hypothetical protein
VADTDEAKRFDAGGVEDEGGCNDEGTLTDVDGSFVVDSVVNVIGVVGVPPSDDEDDVENPRPPLRLLVSPSHYQPTRPTNSIDRLMD